MSHILLRVLPVIMSLLFPDVALQILFVDALVSHSSRQMFAVLVLTKLFSFVRVTPVLAATVTKAAGRCQLEPVRDRNYLRCQVAASRVGLLPVSAAPVVGRLLWSIDALICRLPGVSVSHLMDQKSKAINRR